MNHEYAVQQNGLQSLFYRVYGWMSLGLGLTALTSYIISSHSLWLMELATRPLFGLTLLIVQLVVVVVFVGMLPRLSFMTAFGLFVFYSVLTGATLSILVKVYTLSSLIQALIVTAGMFVSAALYGLFTKSDLSQFRSILLMGLWGIILSSLVNLFLKSSSFNFVIACIGVVLFTALTAYDVNMIKQYAQRVGVSDDENYSKLGLLGAFQLYLDFINLFLSLLTLTGRRKE